MGVDLRAYWNEDSFFYIVPNFQGIIGVDIGVYQGLAITISGGVKQIISDHIDSRNETFISGNLGGKV